MFIQPLNVLKIQEELKKYQELCIQYKFSPAKQEFADIVQFILLHSGDGISESIDYENNLSFDYLYESFMSNLSTSLNEAQHEEVDTVGNFDTAVGIVHGTAKKAILGALGAATLAGLYIAYLMKKGKLRGSMKQEHQLEMSKLEMYQKVITIGVKLAKMKGEPAPKLTDLTQPALSTEPGMPKNPKEDKEK
jgi:hypothetical protein